MLSEGMALNQQSCFDPVEEEMMPKGAVLSGKMPLRVTPVFDTYWKFACERQSIFFRRLEGLVPGPRIRYLPPSVLPIHIGQPTV